MNTPKFAGHRQQQGAVLVIALIMLMVITMISVASVRSNTMDERMAGASRDRNKAFQAAEYALRQCLAPMLVNTFNGNQATNKNLLTPATGTAVPVWEDETKWKNNGVTIAMPAAPTGIVDQPLAEDPACLYELLANRSYRVTARARGASKDTTVVVQATYTTVK